MKNTKQQLEYIDALDLETEIAKTHGFEFLREMDEWHKKMLIDGIKRQVALAMKFMED